MGLLYEIKRNLPSKHFLLLKSYLSDRYFMITHGDAMSELNTSHASVLQGSVLGSMLDLIYTGDLSQTEGITICG